ncbi:MAG: CAP domain-containing protein [Deltaproteobacteria bacterium]|nr:CAP domain-containing protein [Deltaproteobacteria bacterium]
MRPSRPTPPALAVALAACLCGCNLLTGAVDIAVLEDEPAGAKQPQDGAGGGASAAGGAEAGGHDGAGGIGSGAGNGAGADQPGQGGCSPACGAHEHCEAQTKSCVCDPGFVEQGGACSPAPVGDPSTRSANEVCKAWKAGHVVTTPDPFSSSGADCDAGKLAEGGITDTLERLNMFRWLVGLGPCSDDADFNEGAQLCANIESWWPWQGGSPHAPPPDSKCYTAEGAATAGASNIAWGSGHPAEAIDQFMQDAGNDDTMGHRRWILNPPLGPVGIGYWTGGGMYGDAECLRVFASSGGGPSPQWLAFPNPGYAPLAVAQWTWTFHGKLGGIPQAQVSVLRVDDNTPLDVTMKPLVQGFGELGTTSWVPKGWKPQAGATYRVTVSGLKGGDVVYDVKPVQCQ